MTALQKKNETFVLIIACLQGSLGLLLAISLKGILKNFSGR